MTYLQPSELRILPHSHADFTELSSGEFNSESAGPLSILSGPRHLTLFPCWLVQ